MVQIPVFSYCLIPNSISFSIAYSIAYSYCLIPITFVFPLIPQSQKCPSRQFVEFGIGQYENRGICTLQMVQIPVFSYCLIPNSISFSIAYSIAIPIA